MLDHITPFFSLLAFFLVLLPFAWHVRSRNVGTIVLSIWLLLGNLDNFINSMVWWKTMADLAPGYCELSVRLRHVVLVAVPASNLVIARKLESIASTRQVRSGPSDLKRSVIIDLLICLGIPFIYGCLMIVNQSNRYAVIEEVGCWPMLVFSWAWALLVAAPVIVVSLCSAIYSVLAFRWFWIRRRQFQAVLASSASTINRSRYIRLLLLTAVDMLVFFPIYVGIIGRAIKQSVSIPYGSWSSVHTGFNEIPRFSAEFMAEQSFFKVNLIVSRLVCPVSGYVFFAMFGLGREVRQGYREAFRRAMVVCKLQKEQRAPPPQHIVADIEVVTFQSRDTYSPDFTPRSEKFGSITQRSEEA